MRKFAFILILLLVPVFSIQAVSPAVPPAKPIRILLVPGHDNEVWGANYGKLKEADMNLVLATQIYNILKKDPRFEVWITRDQSGYTKEFKDYFANHWDDIYAFKTFAKKEMQNQLVAGAFIAKEGAPHQSVSEDVATRLYGFNKWANENNMDTMIHIHFNDYPHPGHKIGKYKGFTIYMPEVQMSSSKTSAMLGSHILSQLLTKYQTSTFKKEAGGLVPDQKLIALGANDTLNSSVRSVLIEYGYIYQKIFRTFTLRQKAYKTMAGLTTKGIQSYFFGK